MLFFQFESDPCQGVVGADGEPAVRLQGVRERPRAAVRAHVGAARARRAPRPHTGHRQIGRRQAQARLLTAVRTGPDRFAGET